MSGASLNRGASKQTYATPPEFIAAVVKRFGPITRDLAAEPETAKAASFFTKEQDALKLPWNDPADPCVSGIQWLNPPFDNIAPWAKKSGESAGARILLLTPASIGANWFRDHVHGKALVLALNGRISFDGKNPYPKDCILSAYGFGVTGFNVWNWNA